MIAVLILSADDTGIVIGDVLTRVVPSPFDGNESLFGHFRLDDGGDDAGDFVQVIVGYDEDSDVHLVFSTSDEVQFLGADDVGSDVLTPSSGLGLVW